MKKIILVGPAASGKDYFRNYLANTVKLDVDVSYTTRPMRKGEIPGYTYYFVDEEAFDSVDFYERVEFNGWYYGMSKDSWQDNVVFIVNCAGVQNIIEQGDREECVIVYFDIPLETRRERLDKRSDSDSTERRIMADKKDFEGFEDYDIKVTDPKFDPKELLSKIFEI